MAGKANLAERVRSCAQAALDSNRHVSAVDLLQRIGFLSESWLKEWRSGHADSLEEVIQCGPEKLAYVLQQFHSWAAAQGLEGREVEPHGRQGTGARPVPEKRKRAIVEKQSKPPGLVVYQTLNDSECSECGEDLGKGRTLALEKGAVLCLNCADLGHLVFLGAGDMALTRRSRKYSSLSAVVLRFSRTRKRYERQGLLVEEAALDRAEQERDTAAGGARRGIGEGSDGAGALARIVGEIRWQREDLYKC